MFLLATLLIGVNLLVLTLPATNPLRRTGRLLWAGFEGLAHRPWLAAGWLTLWSVSMLCLAYWLIQPHPFVPDEFSNLLQADTFAHGRLTNPVHPLWPFFETLHVVVQPIYLSKYPPAQALLIWLGRALADWPLLGSWIGYTGAVLAVWWALRAFTTSPAALLGGMALAAHPYLLPYFGEMLWGGSVAVAGGALLIGGLWWSRQSDYQPRYAMMMGAGLGLLLISRPLEGLATAVAPSLYLLASRNWRSIVWFGLTAGLSVGLLMTYNNHITGNPLRLPYTLYYEQYEVARPLLIQSPGRPAAVLRHTDMRESHAIETAIFFHRRTFQGFRWAVRAKVQLYGTAFIGLTYALPLLLGFLRPRQRRRGDLPLWTLLVLPVLTLLIETYENPHYAAPLTIVLAGLVVRGFERMPTFLSSANLIVALLAAPVVAWPAMRHEYPWVNYDQTRWHTDLRPARLRAAHERDLMRQGGRHLLLIRYGARHDAFWEWIYNSADIDHQTIVWAHDGGEPFNATILNYYPDRFVWRIDFDTHPECRVLLRRPVKHSRAKPL